MCLIVNTNVCMYVHKCIYVFKLRDARSPANDAVTYAILHNKHKITYIQTSVCVFGALMLQLLLLLFGLTLCPYFIFWSQ